MNTISAIPSISIKKLNFNHPEKISISLEDGRELIVPLKYFPELKKMPLEKRKQYSIVDDRTILFRNSDNVYHLEDFFGLDEYWKQR
jgi:Protein of unknown function (DUF2442)